MPSRFPIAIQLVRFVLILLAVSVSIVGVSAQSNEFRGMWVNAWNTGLQNASQVTTLVDQLRAGNFNAVIPQVRRRGDAFYNGHFEPHATGTTPADFDALADLI